MNFIAFNKSGGGNTSDGVQGTMLAQAQLMNDGQGDSDYSDMEIDANHTNLPINGDDNDGGNLSRYGIGAKLMMQMGYKPGTGLGSNQEGLVNPIETTLRPQGVGVGGVSEKPHHDQPPTPQDDNGKKQRVRLFEIIDELELKGLEVPKTGLFDGDLSITIRKLHHINDEFDIITRQERYLKFKNREIEDKLHEYDNKIHDIEALKQLLTSNQPQISQFTKILSSETKTSLVNYLYPQLTTMFIDQDVKGLSTYLEVYKLLKDYDKPILNPWDSLIYKQLSLIIQEFLKTQHHQEILETLQYWKSQDIVINPLTFNKVIDDTVYPWMEKSINDWIPIGNSPLFILGYLKLNNWRDLTPLVQIIYDKYIAYFRNPIRGGDEDIESLKIIWWEVFQQFLGPNAINQFINKIFANLLLYFDDYKDFECLFKWSKLLTIEQFELIMQFKLFNPLIIELESNKHKPYYSITFAETTKRYYSLIKRLLNRYEVGNIDIINWNMNRWLHHQHSLPSLNNTPTPTNGQIIKYITTKEVGVEGIPSYKIMTSFKNVVEQVCIEKGIIFQSSDKIHPELGLQLYYLCTNNHKVECYIKDDVLWIKSHPDFAINVDTVSQYV